MKAKVDQSAVNPESQFPYLAVHENGISVAKFIRPGIGILMINSDGKVADSQHATAFAPEMFRPLRPGAKIVITE